MWDAWNGVLDSIDGLDRIDCCNTILKYAKSKD
jgi:hypothetical protein